MTVNFMMVRESIIVNQKSQFKRHKSGILIHLYKTNNNAQSNKPTECGKISRYQKSAKTLKFSFS